MSLRNFMEQLDNEGLLMRIDKKVDPHLEMAQILKEKDGQTVLFENVRNSEYKVVAGVCSSRDYFAKAIGCSKDDLIFKIADAIAKPSKPKVVSKAACQEVLIKDVDLSRIPIMTHAKTDLGPYITAGVYSSRGKDGRLNASIHRASPIGKNKLVARICHRDLYKNMVDAGGKMPVAIAIGLDPVVNLVGAISAKDVNEFEIGNTLKPFEMVKCINSDLLVPAEAELIMEGMIDMNDTHEEGPFPDITGTSDIVRDKEPVITIDLITQRKNAIYQGLLPACNEHRLMMGMPKEPTIYMEVNKVCKCKNVLLTTGGCSWFHAVVQIEKRNSNDGIKAAEAAFKGHASLKHCVAVEDDINIYDPNDVEWAIATRVQADKNVRIFRGPGSSLDCTAECMVGSDRRETAKVALDATIPSHLNRDKFLKTKLGK
jgi:2,5-furandicarboxylate decarboxylase 1